MLRNLMIEKFAFSTFEREDAFICECSYAYMFTVGDLLPNEPVYRNYR